MEDHARHVIMGTAGHVDHGKTALVRALTGIDTDRLKEERERGISIELGFAHLDLPSGLRVGVVDVPGHERFVKHMLSGAGGIDFVLLVVAADEGVMPQTIEHAQIVSLLGVTRGLVVLTKVDLVTPDLAELAAEDVRELLAETLAIPRGSEWPILRFSAVTGEGREALIRAIDAVAASVPSRSGEGPVRLPIDRVFVMEGFGTVVTGTLWQGTVSEGQQLVLLPHRRSVRVRQVQVHGKKVPAAAAGQRVAVALAGIPHHEIHRGEWLLSPDAFRETSIVDVRLRAAGRGERLIRQRERVRFHLGASETFGRVTLFGRDALAPGADDVAQIRLESPVVAVRGDRFVARWYSPVSTAAGGEVIEPVAAKRRRSDVAQAEKLVVLERGAAADRVRAALAGVLPHGITAAQLAERTGAGAAELDEALAALAAGGEVRPIGGGRFLGASQVADLAAEMEQAARDYQGKFPLRYGIPRGEIRSRLSGRVAAETVDAVVELLIQEGRLFAREDRLRVGGPEVTLPSSLRAVADRLGKVLHAAGYAVPVLRDALTQAGAGSGPEAQELLGYLIARGEVVRLADDLLYTKAQLAELEAKVSAVLRAKGMLTVPDFKEITGVSRKYAVPLLEYLDKSGVSRRMGDHRVPGRALAPSSSSSSS
jgi:selenocysteine-specific elongation factor